MASLEANPEGTTSWRLSANHSLKLKGKLFLRGNQRATPPGLPVLEQKHLYFQGVVSLRGVSYSSSPLI